MSPPERTYRHVDTSRPTVDQFLRGGESAKMSPTYSPNYSKSPSSPYFERLKHHDPEEDQGLYQKKSSVLVKMREGVKRLRNSFRIRKQEEDGNLTPSWGVSLEDYEEEEDAEYLGAPMYESELAPEGYKENARQHPRANPVISEKHVLHSSIKSRVEQDQEKQPSLVNSTTTTQPSTTTTTTHHGPNMKMTGKNSSEKLAPAYAAAAAASYSDAANSIPSKIQGLSVSKTTSAKMSSQTSSTAPPTPSISSAPLSTQTSLSSSPSINGRNTFSPKGASVKEYLKIKFEPGNDEKVLSEVIYEAMSPRRTTSTSDAGVIDKVREAVNSLLHNEEPTQQYGNKTTSSQTTAIVSNNNVREVGQEENHGRILQAN
ncbi:hypothetical protein TanjilG_04488 [Lupinus angustifolius]|uniref:LTI65/LTI78 PGEED repeat domain-containing protein n=2 Tax=Lupinus angustifolius TaxID=3871 RepID=A0A4P1RQM3_LUPAN|nr:hypothetical protein TanjilG_04488 [Lupinus angustifolius]